MFDRGVAIWRSGGAPECRPANDRLRVSLNTLYCMLSVSKSFTVNLKTIHLDTLISFDRTLVVYAGREVSFRTSRGLDNCSEWTIVRYSFVIFIFSYLVYILICRSEQLTIHCLKAFVTFYMISERTKRIGRPIVNDVNVHLKRLVNEYKTRDPESFEECKNITYDVLIKRVRSCINNQKRILKKYRKIAHSTSSVLARVPPSSFITPSPIITKPITTIISTTNSSSPSTSTVEEPSTSPTTVQSHALVQVTSSSNTPVIHAAPSTIHYNPTVTSVIFTSATTCNSVPLQPHSKVYKGR